MFCLISSKNDASTRHSHLSPGLSTGVISTLASRSSQSDFLETEIRSCHAFVQSPMIFSTTFSLSVAWKVLNHLCPGYLSDLISNHPPTFIWLDQLPPCPSSNPSTSLQQGLEDLFPKRTYDLLSLWHLGLRMTS